jgi:ribosomal protein S18 acetylase RimI-like enzyme
MQALVQDLAPASVIPAIEANLEALWRHYAQLPGAELYDAPDLLWVATDLPFAFFNGVLRTRLRPENIESTITTTLQHFARRQVPMLWLVTAGTRPADLGWHLAEHGLVQVIDDPGMALDLNMLPDSLPSPHGLTVERVDNAESLRTWSSFGEPALADALFAWGSAIGFGPERELFHYLGRLDGRPVATATLILGGGVAGISNVMTVPDVQRQGIGRLMTVTVLREARTRGYRVGVLQSSKMGLPLYRSLGFQEYCRVAGYLWQGTAASEIATV